MKFLNLFKSKPKSEEKVDFSKEDVALLASMCSFCSPYVIKRTICVTHYAYYIPHRDNDLDLAKDLFERNGIRMQVHYSFIKSRQGQYVLRMKYKNKQDSKLYKRVFTEIVRESDYLLTEEGRVAEAQIAQRLAQVRESYNGR